MVRNSVRPRRLPALAGAVYYDRTTPPGQFLSIPRLPILAIAATRIPRVRRHTGGQVMTGKCLQAIVLASILAGASPASRADAVAQWNKIAIDDVTASSRTSAQATLNP